MCFFLFFNNGSFLEQLADRLTGTYSDTYGNIVFNLQFCFSFIFYHGFISFWAYSHSFEIAVCSFPDRARKTSIIDTLLRNGHGHRKSRGWHSVAVSRVRSIIGRRVSVFVSHRCHHHIYICYRLERGLTVTCGFQLLLLL